MRFREFHAALSAKRARHKIHGGKGLRFTHAREVAPGARDAQPLDASIERWRDRCRATPGAYRIKWVSTAHCVISQRQIFHGTRKRPDMIKACDERKSAGARKPAIARLQSKQTA